MRPFLIVALAIAGSPLIGAFPGPHRSTAFHPPEVILDGSEHGRMFPAFTDLDGDGKIDLLAGTVNRLLVYSNTGTNDRSAYGKLAYLDATVPTARIPDG